MGKHTNSRTENFSKNAVFAMLFEVLAALLAFIVRWFFIRCLRVEYLGMGGLFTNILTILSLAELGAGSAIVYSMYKPLAENNTERIKSLMYLYKTIYLWIGTAIFVLGMCVIPFLDFFVKEQPSIPYTEFILIYVLTVIQTASSYFFCYRFSIYSANQKGRIIQKYGMFFSVLRSVLQVFVLIFLKNYIAYLIVAIVVTLINNIILSQKANREYPFLKEKAEKLDRESVHKIKKNIFALLLYKLGITVATTIDTLLISKFFGLIYVGIYSNYHLIISYSDKLFSSVLGTITPSLGNLMVTGTDEKKLQVFSALQLIYYWLATYLAVALLVLFNPFIEVFFGKEFLFEQSMVIALVVSITLTNFQRPCGLTRDATGLFWYGKLRPFAMSILNVIFSLIAIKRYGIIGVLIGTALSKAMTYAWYDPYIVYKYALKGSLLRYFIKYAFHWVLLATLTIVCSTIYSFIGVGGILGLVYGGIIITIIVNGVFFALYFKSDAMKYLVSLIKPILSKGKGCV